MARTSMEHRTFVTANGDLRFYRYNMFNHQYTGLQQNHGLGVFQRGLTNRHIWQLYAGNVRRFLLLHNIQSSVTFGGDTTIFGLTWHLYRRQ